MAIARGKKFAPSRLMEHRADRINLLIALYTGGVRATQRSGGQKAMTDDIKIDGRYKVVQSCGDPSHGIRMSSQMFSSRGSITQG